MLLQEKRLAETLAAKEANERKRRKVGSDSASFVDFAAAIIGVVSFTAFVFLIMSDPLSFPFVI